MRYPIEIVLREHNEAVSDSVQTAVPAHDWSDPDVETVLKAMLLAIDRLRNPKIAEADRYVALRGFSWIVEPTDGGVVIAIEIPSGAAVAGPFDIPQPRLDAMVRRVLAVASPARPTVH
jgi:hypothetical protein